MRKKKTEKYIKKVERTHIKSLLNDESADRVWETLNHISIPEDSQPEKKKRVVNRYSIMSCAAACAIIVISVVVAKQYIFNNPMSNIGDPTLKIDSSSTETHSKPNLEIPSVSVSSKPAGTLDDPLLGDELPAPLKIFTFDGKQYQIEDSSQADLIQKKGNYLGEADGLKLYEFIGRNNAVIVDMATVIGASQGNSLYPATVIE